ncbi:unnamed protein product [Ophioblennius macclurei]
MERTVLLCAIVTSLAGVCSLTPQAVHVRSGEMVALRCQRCNQHSGDVAEPLWTSEALNVTLKNPSLAEQRRMGVLLYETSLIILRASKDHGGDYSCSFGSCNEQSRFRLTVHPPQSKEFEKKHTYLSICYAQELCKLTCPDRNIPSAKTPNMRSSAIIWRKDGDPSKRDGHFSSVDEKDSGVYTCTRPYLYLDNTYNISFRVELQVKPKEIILDSKITYPQENQVFYVDLDAPKVIECKAVLYSEFDEVFWLTDQSFVDTNDSLRVFYNSTRDGGSEETRMTASLVFRKVSPADLTKDYSCKLESDHQSSTFVTVILRTNDRLSSFPLTLCIISFLVFLTVAAALSLKYKTNIALFVRDTLGCHRQTADGKIYDAHLMCYKSDADSALDREDRKWLVNVLEERFGYSLCPVNRNAETEKEALLGRMEQSRAVVLVPASPESSETDSEVLTDVHADLLQQRGGARLVLIDTETAGSLPETVRLLAKPRDRVTWRGHSSRRPSSNFCNQLRYRLPAPRHAPTRHRHRNALDANC